MIKSVTFINFRNLDGKYEFNNTLNVIIGKSLNVKNLYTAITRTTKNVYSTISQINRE